MTDDCAELIREGKHLIHKIRLGMSMRQNITKDAERLEAILELLPNCGAIDDATVLARDRMLTKDIYEGDDVPYINTRSLGKHIGCYRLVKIEEEE